MGLDLHVLPLWRFFAGRFEGPAEAIGATRLGSAKPNSSERRARRRVAHIRQRLSRELGRALRWRDEGAVALSTQYDYAPLQALRAFAAFQDHPPRTRRGRFTLDPDRPQDHPSLQCVYDLESPTRFPHLIHHSDSSGFYLPCDFPQPLPCTELVDAVPDTSEMAADLPPELKALAEKAIDDPDKFMANVAAMLGGTKARTTEEKRVAKLSRQFGFPPRPERARPKPPKGKTIEDWYRAGSSIRLLAELDELNRLLGLKRDWGELANGEGAAKKGDPLGSVKYGWSVLHYAARVSVRKRLPLVFDG